MGTNRIKKKKKKKRKPNKPYHEDDHGLLLRSDFLETRKVTP